MTTASRLMLLDPVSEIVEDGAVLSPRLDTLNGKVVGLYSNDKLNATKLLDMIGDILSERYDLQRIVRGKYNGGRVMRPEEWVDVHKCDAIVLTHGDWGSCSSSGLLNSIELEKMGIPATLISTKAFNDTCRDMAKIGGLPEMRWALCPHPLGSLTDEGLMERAESASEQFAAIVTGR